MRDGRGRTTAAIDVRSATWRRTARSIARARLARACQARGRSVRRGCVAVRCATVLALSGPCASRRIIRRRAWPFPSMINTAIRRGVQGSRPSQHGQGRHQSDQEPTAHDPEPSSRTATLSAHAGSRQTIVFPFIGNVCGRIVRPFGSCPSDAGSRERYDHTDISVDPVVACLFPLLHSRHREQARHHVVHRVVLARGAAS